MTMCAYFSTMIFIIILWTSICLQDAQAIRKPFEVVKICPFNESEWKVRAAHMTCNGSESYHCLLTEGGVSLREQCTETSLFTSGFCPIFTNEGYLQWSACKDTACPASSYRSDQVYQYQICYRKADNPVEKNTRKGSNDNSSINQVTVIIVAILLVFILVSVLMVCYVRNQYGFKDKVRQCITDIRTHFPCFPCFQQSTDIEGLKDVEKVEPEQAELLKQDEPVYAKPNKDKTKKDSKPANSKSTSDSKGEEHIHDKDAQKHNPPEQEILLLPQEPEYATPIKKKAKRDIHYEPEKKIEKLRDLLKYLVDILKQELAVNDLKEKAVIHSKSINKHFSEPLRKGLQRVKDLNDYNSKLDMSLVFALLQNFCEGMKPPSRGWDYEPPDDETHVSADIERIRFMWNKYCDNDLGFKHLDDVYNRMKHRYGAVSKRGDDGVRKSPSNDEENTGGFEILKDKIQSIKLNPDCSVKKDIVITENVTTALKILKSKNVLILKGTIGCGKTHALMAIQNHFQDKEWKVVWVESEYFQRGIADEKPTILLCDNLFGKFGCSIFSQDAVNKTEKVLKEIESSKQTKVVIGIHTHVHEEVKKSLKLNFLQQKNITVEMDNLSEAETLLIFKEQLKRGHCKTDLNCWFKKVGFQSVLDKLSKNQGHIGGPFLSLMYCNQHELFSDEAFSNNPIQTLMQHFQRMKQDSLFSCLLYLMCVQEHNCDKEPEKWAGLIDADVTKHKLKDIATTSGYVQMESNEETLVHEILAIVLFKSAAETSEELFSPVVKRCKLDLMIQILRPVSTNNDLYCGFMDVDKKSKFREIGKIFVGRCVIDKTLDLGHPLRTSDFVQKKFKKWQEKPSKWVAEKLRMGD